MQVTCPFCQGKITLMQGKQAVYGRCGCGASVFTAKGVKLGDFKKPPRKETASEDDWLEDDRDRPSDSHEKEYIEIEDVMVPSTPGTSNSIAQMLRRK